MTTETESERTATRKPRRYVRCYDGAQWLFTREQDGEELSVICHGGSYGGTRGYFEVWGMGGEPLGWLDFDDVSRVIALFQKGENRREAYEEAVHPKNYTAAAEAVNEGI